MHAIHAVSGAEVTPSGVRLFPCWNDLTASCVFGPNWLSMSETFNTFVITKIICSRRTSGPAEPIDKIGPLFTISSPHLRNARARTECGLTFLPGHSQDATRNYAESPGTAYRCCLHPSTCAFGLGFGAQYRWRGIYRSVYEQLCL